MKKSMTIALVSHIIKDDNLGCGALAISNIRLLDEVLEDLGVKVKYIVATTDNLEQLPLEQYTKNEYEYRIYPRCKQSLKNPFRLLNTKVFEGCDLAINLCGGDGYADIYGFGRLLAESQLAWIAKKNSVPMIYAPQTIGPFSSGKGRFVAKKTLKKLDRIFVRDNASYKCCESLNLADKTTEVIDVAFALPYTKINQNSDKLNVGINVSGLLYNGGYDRKNYFGLSFSYKEYVEKLLAKLCSDDSVTVHLIPHVNSYRTPVDDDYSVCEELAKRFGCKLAPRYDSPIDAKSYICGMDIFSGARMHSTIGAISSGVPVIPVAYSRKFNGLYGVLEYKWLIDAKAKMTADEAVDLFFDYMSKRELMKQDVIKASNIYTAKLEEYRYHLKSVLRMI